MKSIFETVVVVFIVCMFVLGVGMLNERNKYFKGRIAGPPWVAIWLNTAVYARFHENERYCAIFWHRGERINPYHDYIGTVLCKEIVPVFSVRKAESRPDSFLLRLGRKQNESSLSFCPSEDAK